MTRYDYVRYLRARKNTILTTKSLILSAYWTVRKIEWTTVARISGILLALHTLTNAMLLQSKSLAVISFVLILISLKLIKR